MSNRPRILEKETISRFDIFEAAKLVIMVLGIWKTEELVFGQSKYHFRIAKNILTWLEGNSYRKIWLKAENQQI